MGRPRPPAPLLLLLGLQRWAGAAGQTPGFLLVSAPRNAKISWVKLPEDGDLTNLKPETLVGEGLHHPQGIAVDQKRKRLYVADPDVAKIYSYQLVITGDVLTTDGSRTVVSHSAESRWVAVDGMGNVFFSDEPRSLILKVPAAQLRRGDMQPEVVYSGGTFSQVNEPGGVAVDNLNVYWTNKHFGTQAGSVVRGAEAPLALGGLGGGAGSLSVLASNAVKTYGVCLALGNVFFTNSEKSIYGVKKAGGPVVEVSSALNRPRGCAWDGDGTVYVADRVGAVYSFAGNMRTISRAEVRRAFAFEDAFGLAAIRAGAHGRPLPLAAALAAALALLAAPR